ncbi:9814_t:CDS:2 [Entrophospora sp. SA101]|nr:9814_t:CDS:2 [Entrophospora sp. SA101]
MNIQQEISGIYNFSNFHGIYQDLLKNWEKLQNSTWRMITLKEKDFGEDGDNHCETFSPKRLGKRK